MADTRRAILSIAQSLNVHLGGVRSRYKTSCLQYRNYDWKPVAATIELNIEDCCGDLACSFVLLYTSRDRVSVVNRRPRSGMAGMTLPAFHVQDLLHPVSLFCCLTVIRAQ